MAAPGLKSEYATDAKNLPIDQIVFADMRALERPSREQEQLAGRILKAARQGQPLPGIGEEEVNEARRLLVENNMRWVVKVALSIKRLTRTQLDDNALIAAGLYGAALAADRFDPDRGVRFMTYATPAIRQNIFLAIALDEPIKIPEGHRKLTRTAAGISRRLTEELGHPPSTIEICAHMPGVSEEALLAMMQASIVPLSLNSSSTRDEDKDELQDIIADPRGNDPLENLIQENLKYKLRQALNLLPEEQRSALSYRFGISNSGEECPSLREPEISAVMGISLERVRRLIDKGLESLKRRPVVESLNAV